MFDGALKDAHAGGLRTEVLAHLGQSFDAVQTAWHRLSDTPPDLAGPSLDKYYILPLIWSFVSKTGRPAVELITDGNRLKYFIG